MSLYVVIDPRGIEHAVDDRAWPFDVMHAHGIGSTLYRVTNGKRVKLAECCAYTYPKDYGHTGRAPGLEWACTAQPMGARHG